MPRSDDPSTPRRQFLRRTAGVAGLAATAGCLGVRDRVSPPATAIGGTDAGAENALSREAFAGFVERQRERYGDHGVWGTAGTEPDHDASFAGAWTRTIGLDTDGDPEPQPDSPADLRAVVAAAVAAYEIPGRGDAGEHYHQLWLWAAARLPGEHDGGLLASTPALRRLEVGVTLDGAGAEMGPYSPGGDWESGPVEVGPVSPGVDGPSAAFPLEAGAVGPSPDRTGFDQNAYAVRWSGTHDAVQSVAGTCEASWGDEGRPSFDLSVRLAADRRRL